MRTGGGQRLLLAARNILAASSSVYLIETLNSLVTDEFGVVDYFLTFLVDERRRRTEEKNEM